MKSVKQGKFLGIRTKKQGKVLRMKGTKKHGDVLAMKSMKKQGKCLRFNGVN